MNTITSFAHVAMNHDHVSIPVLPIMLVVALVVAALWSIFWKGLALWHAARNKAPVWFVVLLVVNTAGILEIVYLFGVAKLKANELFKK